MHERVVVVISRYDIVWKLGNYYVVELDSQCPGLSVWLPGEASDIIRCLSGPLSEPLHIPDAYAILVVAVERSGAVSCLSVCFGAVHLVPFSFIALDVELLRRLDQRGRVVIGRRRRILIWYDRNGCAIDLRDG